MTDDTSSTRTDEADSVATDGGGAVADHRDADYLEAEVNLLSPSTPYMREHQRIIWTGFLVWCFTTFGPVTATRLAPDLMTTTMPLLGFPFHYFAIAIGGPGGALVLSVWYAWQRDKLDEKYGIDHSSVVEDEDPAATAADGGTAE